MRLGFYMGYAPPGTNPLELLALAQEAERLGYDSAWAAEAWGTDCVTVLSWLGATDREDQARLGDHADPRPHAVEHGDDGSHSRPPVRRPLPARSRHVRAAGRRGLARPAVGKAAREDARVRRDRPDSASARPRRAPRHALRHPALERHRPRQAVEADGPAASRGHPDLPRGDGSRRRSRRRSRSPTAGSRSSGRRRRRATRSAT